MSKSIKINKYLSYYYAGASGDFNLIHIDNEFARGEGLNGIIIHGLCTMGIATNRLIEDQDPGTLKSIKVRFANPVFPEDELRVEVDAGTTQERFVVVNQSGEEVIKRGRAIYRDLSES
tara:strand:- start:31100 stop:31456 length:357 start_codon:yes stop_codon:yes gene_type:complete